MDGSAQRSDRQLRNRALALIGLLGLGLGAAVALGALALVAGLRAGRWLLAAAPVVVLVILGARLPGIAPLAGPPLAVMSLDPQRRQAARVLV